MFYISFYFYIIDEEVDGESLAFLTEGALSSLVDKVGPRMKLLRIIKMMKDDAHEDCASSSGYSDSNVGLESISESSVEVLQDTPRCLPSPGRLVQHSSISISIFPIASSFTLKAHIFIL